ncbi:MAG: hypothetical protein RL693_1391 [Verrucomicrobiota bacterium]|jgi:CHAD domain-containing protein
MSRKPDPQKRKRSSPPAEAGPRLAWVISDLLRQATGDLNRVQEHPEAAIHHLRRRMKKLESLIRLTGKLAGKDTRRQIAQLMLGIKNAFSDQRDQTVMESLAFHMGGATLARQLTQKGKAEGIHPTAVCLDSATQLAEILSALPVSSLTWTDLKKAHQQTAREARRLWRRALEEPTPKHFHECRKETKALFYQLLFIRLIKGRRKRKIRHAKELSHWLGKHHDLHVLRKALKQRQLLDASRQEDIRKREASILKRALRAGRKLHGRD